MITFAMNSICLIGSLGHPKFVQSNSGTLSLARSPLATDVKWDFTRAPAKSSGRSRQVTEVGFFGLSWCCKPGEPDGSRTPSLSLPVGKRLCEAGNTKRLRGSPEGANPRLFGFPFFDDMQHCFTLCVADWVRFKHARRDFIRVPSIVCPHLDVPNGITFVSPARHFE